MTDYQAIVRKSRLYPVLQLEAMLTHERRERLIKWLGGLAFALLPALFIPWLFIKLLGLLVLVLAFLLILQMLEAYFRAYYFGSIISNEYSPKDIFTFTVGRILDEVKGGDLLAGFANSLTGRRMLHRAGITAGAMTQFLADRATIVSPELPTGQVFFLRRLTEILITADPAFAQFLLQVEIRPEDWLVIADWTARQIETEARAERWWSRDQLSHRPTLAADWSYGVTYQLDRYARDLMLDPLATAGGEATGSEVEQIGAILRRSRERNALLIGPAGEGKLEVLWQLARAWRTNHLTRRLLLINTSLLLSSFPDKNSLEQSLLRIWREAATAGNVVLVIDNLANLVLGAERLGSDVIALLDHYLASAALPLIALSDSATFHQQLESRAALLGRFEKVALIPLPPEQLILGLTAVIEQLERQSGVWFTYQAVRELGQAARQYFSGAEIADEVNDLAVELIPWALGRHQAVIGKAEVLAFVGEKTGIPLDLGTAADRDKLLHLEDRLRRRIIGQTAALEAISKSLRRARAGVRNPNRPIGSFLFLGPTGVGKTETAKALGDIFFGSQHKLQRLDMSEFQGPEALTRLIGSFEGGKTGILADRLREQPYGVLLLDEFEKTDREVLNLFLQILDEGFFSDTRGERVNARNTLFVATSNAAAETIWEMVKQGQDPSAAGAKIVDRLVTGGIFRPELLNRFDDVIIFHPLGPAELKQVAALQLGRLSERLREQGITLKITDAAITDVVQNGANPLFGARPMQRYIQDHIEEPIARQIISGELKSGDTATV